MAELALALSYLIAPPDGLWRWADDGDTLAWHDGTTVAFRAEVVAVLETLAPNGLPPFHAVVLLLAACRGKVPDDPARLLQSGVKVPDTTGEDALVDQLAAAIGAQERRYTATLELLRALGRFPTETRAGTRAKTVLMEAVFETTTPALAPEDAGAVLRALGSGSLGTDVLNGRSDRVSAAEYAPAVHALHEGLKNLTPAALASRQRTGLDRGDLAPAGLPEDLRPPAERVRRLLAELRTDPEHAGLARVARDILGALELPRRLSEPEEFALGGVADLANRGSLDRLLLSELAHDDDTLATRVALNEALYLRREPPAAPPPAAFALLLDTGLRMWGVPRLFAAAVALALGATGARRGSLTVFRAAGAGVSAVDLFTAAGLAELLGALRTEAHPGAALPAFLDALGNNGGVNRTEAVVITHRDALADAGFRRALDAAAERPDGPALLLAVVDRAGGFALWPYPPEARTPWCEATVRLEDLLPTPPAAPTATPLLDPRRPADLPVFLSVRPTPLRLPVAGDVDATLQEAGGGTFAVVNGRALYVWDRADRGAELVAHGLPGGPTLLVNFTGSEMFILKGAWHDGTIPLARVDLARDAPRPEVHRLPMRCPPLGAFAEGNIAFLVFRPRVDVWNLRTGEKLQEIVFPGSTHWMGGRYFVRHVVLPGENKPRREWHFLSWEGLLGALHPVPGRTEDVVAMWDRAGLSGPWALTRAGHVRRWEERAGKPTFAFNLPPDAKVRVSRDGHRLLIGEDQARVLDVVNLVNPGLGTYPHPAAKTLFEPESEAPAYSTRRRFEAVCALPAARRLLLRSNKGRLVEFTPGGEEGGGTLTTVSDPPHAAEWWPFAPLPLTPERGYTLGAAAWPNGSRAFLDSRGLLHLKSADLAVPELTLVLTEAASAAWASTGERCGHPFFVGDQGPLAPAAGLREILDRFLENTRA